VCYIACHRVVVSFIRQREKKCLLIGDDNNAKNSCQCVLVFMRYGMKNKMNLFQKKN